MMALGTEAKTSDLLVFLLDGMRFGIPALDVVELTLAVAVTPLPNAAQVDLDSLPFLEGIVDYHGELAGVISLQRRFGQKSKPLSACEHFIFARCAKSLVALRVDRVLDITSAQVSDLALLESLSTIKSSQKNVTGAAKLSDGLVLIFDLFTFLTTSETEALAHILSLARAQVEGSK